jgi:hypothetical protein
VAQEVTGIFVDNPADTQPKDSNPNTPEQQKIVDMVDADYQVFRAKRQDIEDTWRLEDRMYEGGKRQWEGLRSEATMKSRPNSSDNIAGSQIDSITSALTGWTPEGKYLATEDGDEQKSQDITKFMPFEMRQIKFKAKYVKAVRRFVNHGLLLFKNIHDPTVEGGRGNNRFTGQNDIIPLDYGSFFPDPRIGDLLYIQKSKALIINQRKDIEYFKERWTGQGAKVQPDNYSSDVQIFEQDRTPSQNTFNTTSGSGEQTEKQKTAGLIEYWYKGVPKMMTAKDKQAFKDLAEQKLQDGIDPTEALAKADGKAKGIHCIYQSSSGVFLEHISYVYDHGQYPITVRCLFPVEGSIWPKGYMRDLISPQIMLNKFSELAVEQTAKMGNGAIIYEEGSIAESKIPIWKRIRSQVGAMLPVLRKDGVQELEGKGPPVMIMNFIQHWLTILQKIPRRFDSINGGTSAPGESGRHAEALQSAAQGNLSTATELIEDGLVESFEQYIELIAQFYTQERIGRVLGKSMTMSRSSIVSTAPTEYDTGNQVPHPDTGEMIPEVKQVQEEYVPQFDISVSIGVEKPQDREYWVQTAMTLFQTIDPMTQMPVIDAKAVIYTVDNGRMEPFEVIEERMQSDQKIMQQMQQLQQQLQQTQQENQVMHNMLVEGEKNKDKMMQDQQTQQGNNQNDAVKANNEAQAQQFQQQQQAHKMDMDKAKMLLETHKVLNPPVKEAVGSGKK